MKNRLALVRAFPKHGVGVEVGVFQGNFSQVLLQETKPRALYLVDPWMHQPDTVYVDTCNRTRREFRAIYRNVKLRFARYATVHVIKAKSLRAVRMFDDVSFDWIYIDGNHGYEAVRDDLVAWWPKLKPDGIFAGHDYIDQQPRFGVKPAVDEFALQRGVLVGVTAPIPFLAHTETQVNRPGPNLIQKTISLAVALTTGRRVSDERIRRRVEICSRCRYVRIRKTLRGSRKLNCGICGCRLRGRHALINLARYEETRRWGCKHPKGSRWRRAGV